MTRHSVCYLDDGINVTVCISLVDLVSHIISFVRLMGLAGTMTNPNHELPPIIVKHYLMTKHRNINYVRTLKHERWFLCSVEITIFNSGGNCVHVCCTDDLYQYIWVTEVYSTIKANAVKYKVGTQLSSRQCSVCYMDRYFIVEI